MCEVLDEEIRCWRLFFQVKNIRQHLAFLCGSG